MTHKMKFERIPAEYKNLIILPDLHIPKHDAHAIWLACDYGKKNKADVIVLSGDVMDNTAFGRFGHKPEHETAICKIFDQAITLFETIRAQFPKALIYWTEGNHDIWFSKYIQSNARVLQNDPYFSLPKRLRLEEFGIKYVPENTVLKFGDFHIAHGHQFFRGAYAGINPGKNIFHAVNANMICGHVHRESKWMQKGMDGKQKMALTTGCLSVLSPDYAPYANYSQGFAHLYKKTGRVIARNLTIEKEVMF